MKPVLNYMMLHHDDLADEFNTILGYRTSHAAMAAVDVLDPTDLAATAVSASQIDLTWTDNSNNESGFVIDYSTDGGNWTRAGTAAADATSYSITGLAESTLYYVRVGAYNAVGISSYTTDSATTMTSYAGHNMVTFSGDYLTLGANPFPSPAEYFTAVWKINISSFAGTRNLLWANAAATIRVTITTGYPAVSFANIDGQTFTGTPSGGLTAATNHVLHVAGRNATVDSDSLLTIWIDGVQVAQVSGGVSGGYTFDTYSNWGLFGTTAGANLFSGTCGFAWITAGTTADHYIGAAGSGFANTFDFGTGSSDVDLGADGSEPGVQPIIFFGGTQVAADWNAGTNLGSGADWTMNGSVA